MDHLDLDWFDHRRLLADTLIAIAWMAWVLVLSASLE